jgi:hypothetical protein
VTTLGQTGAATGSSALPGPLVVLGPRVAVQQGQRNRAERCEHHLAHHAGERHDPQRQPGEGHQEQEPDQCRGSVDDDPDEAL